ncbi:MAG: histidine kinase [Oscillospiraceae bacterium]
MLKFLANMKLKYKLLISYVVIIIVLILSCNIFFEQAIREMVSDHIISSGRNLLELAGRDAASCINAVTNIENSFILNADLQKTISNSPTQLSVNEQLNDYSLLENTIHTYESYQNISRVALMLDKNLIYADNGINFFPFPDDISTVSDFEKLVYSSGGEIVWSTPFVRTDINGHSTRVICAGRLIRSYFDFSKVVGAVFVDVPEAVLRATLTTASYFNNSLLLYAPSGKLICQYSPNDTVVDFPDKIDLLAPKLNTDLHRDYLITQTDVTNNGWILVSALPYSSINREIIVFRNKLLYVTALITLLAIGFSLLLSHLYTERIENLVQCIKRAPYHKFKQLPISHTDEISILETHFNMLFEQIDNLMAKQFELGRQMEKSQYDLLRCQINPHFLYNTLDFINLTSIKNDVPEIQDVILSLAKFYKLSLNRGNDNATLRDEIEQIKAYIQIQNHRFQNPITLHLNIEPCLYDCMLPNLILQPIVENSVIHGLQNITSTNGIVLISAAIADNVLEIVIEDNGCGCNTAMLNHSLVQHDAQGYGVYNVHRRIQISHGNSYGLFYSASELGGVKAVITLPKID